MANPKGTPANLVPPPKKGEVRNPKGNNQYTYRRVFEDAIDKLLVEQHGKTGKTYAQILAETALKEAEAGDKTLLTEVMKRTWPVTQTIQVTDDRDAPTTIDSPDHLERIKHALAESGTLH